MPLYKIGHLWYNEKEEREVIHMRIILTLDDRNGMTFNHRRQSRDRVQLAHLLRLTDGHALYMTPYTATLFAGDLPSHAVVVPNPPESAGAEDDCFIEDVATAPYRSRISALLIYRWNRDYPADRHLDIDLSGWAKTVIDEFPGSSHDRITLEQYTPPPAGRKESL